jgi:hypothetical protein
MLIAIIGFALLVLSFVNYSSFYKPLKSYELSYRRFFIYCSVILIALGIESLLGLLITRNLINLQYHAVLGFAMLLIVFILVNLDLIRYTYKLFEFNREGFKALMNVTMIFLLLYHFGVFIPLQLTVIIGIVYYTTCVVATIYLYRYIKVMSTLVNFIDLLPSLKALVFSFMMLSVSAIIWDLHGLIGGSIFVSMTFLFIAYAYLLLDIHRSYIKPLKKVQ